MKLGGLLDIVRIEIGDTKTPYLLSDAELIDAAADAENEACRRSRLIIDSSTPKTCQIEIYSGEPLYALDHRVLFVRRAKLGTQSRPLNRVSFRDLDANIPGWESHIGQPTHYATDFETGKIRLYPTPIVAETLSLTVVRLPLNPLADETQTPEIKTHYHNSLRFWIMYRAYLKQDADTFDKEKAANSLALFEQEFGPKSRAIDEEWIEREQAADPYDGTF
jgi:hypothetical protein